MRLIALALALALAALPAFAQTQVAPGVQITRPHEGMPGMASPGMVPPGMVPPGMVQPGLEQQGFMPAGTPGMQADPISGPTAPTHPNEGAGPRTAAEQGLVDHSGAEAARQMLEDARARSTPRQRGIVVPAPTLARPVSSDAPSREWLHNWEFTLQQLGVSREKIRFEAGRLSKTDFEAWASRQFRFRQADHARVQVLERHSLCEAGAGC